MIPILQRKEIDVGYILIAVSVKTDFCHIIVMKKNNINIAEVIYFLNNRLVILLSIVIF